MAKQSDVKAPEFPQAVVRESSSGLPFLFFRATKFWWLTIICVGLAATLVFFAVREPGTQILIKFRSGHSVEAGDPLRHRGIEVGKVVSARLAEDLGSVDVTVRLVESSTQLARSGSLFWIVRPHVSLSGVRGLETVVGGGYLAVLPGEADGDPQSEFEGMEEPPALLHREEGGLEIILEGDVRAGLQSGSPVTYRGVSVGRIASVRLSSDAASVEARAYIEPTHRALVRTNTRFWSTSGLQVEMGLSGVRLDLESLATFVNGGVALGTPDPTDEPTGEPAATGWRYQLGPEPGNWTSWRPRIAVGGTVLPAGLTVPQPLRAALSWSENAYLGLTRQRQRDGWVIVLDDGRFLALAELLSPVEGAIDDTVTLALRGKQFEIAKGTTSPHGLVATLTIAELSASQIREFENTWPINRLRAPKEPEDAVVVGDPQRAPFPIAVGRLESSEVDGNRVWIVAPSIPLDPTRSIVARCLSRLSSGRHDHRLSRPRPRAETCRTTD